jgi:hypothetical protein
MHDEAVLPSTIYTNPEHANFVEEDAPNCAAESKVYRYEGRLRITMHKSGIDSDGLKAVRVCFMKIHGAFEDFDASDELTGLSVGDVLELTKETTDRQTYPIYDGTKMSEKYTNSALQDAKVPNLTTTQVIENVDFDIETFYDMLHYSTISSKLRSVTTGLRWLTLTTQNPTRVVKFRITSSVKSMNPYAFLGILFHAPLAGTKYQIPIATDVTTTAHLVAEMSGRYLEWNDNFNHERA